MASQWNQIERSNEPETILEIRDVSVEFDMERGRSRVLDSANLDVHRNEILGVVGESGSGKSMFASALLDAVVDPSVTKGEITFYPSDSSPAGVLDLTISELKQLRWEEISMVFQGAMSSFNPTLTIRAHFEETIEAHNRDQKEGMEQARQLLSDLSLNPDRVLRSYPHELSGGMKQRALIALSLVLEPEVLVMDEPTAALDLVMQRSILILLRDLKEKYDLTIIFITHDLPLVAELADRIAVMYAFEFVEVGPMEEILRNASHPYTRALLNATPSLDAPLNEMGPIDGSSPDPVNVPSGCSYHPRCPIAQSDCEELDPELEDVDVEHQAACWYTEQARGEIPLGLEHDDEQAQRPTVTTNVDVDDREPIISLENIQVHFENDRTLFGDSEVVRAVDDVSLDVYPEDVIVLVGESGCGKTTLGKTAIGLMAPTSGTVTYRGQDIWEAKYGDADVDIPFGRIRRALQIIHQDPGGALNPNRMVQASLEQPLKKWYSNLSSRERVNAIIRMLETVDMQPADDYIQRYPHQLSGGEKQRVALIRALLMSPDLILADEAVSALDVSLRVEMMDLMLELQEQFETSYIFVSHNLSNARYIASKANGRIAVMYLGEIVEIGPAEEIIQNPKHPYTKALQWATTSLDPDHISQDSEIPMQKIDIPDSVNPPSGCRFHTRCPEARDVCTQQKPELIESETKHHRTACYLEYDGDHPYWESPDYPG